jgi:polyisoprenoid-binding protein YceI
LHIAGALKHQLAANRAEWVVPRMIPVALGRVWGALVLALGVLGLAFALPWLVFRPVAPVALAPAAGPEPTAPAPTTPAPAPAETPEATAPAEATAAPVDTAWAVDQGGELGFTATVNGSPVEGHFAKWAGKIAYDPQAPEAAKVAITVNLASAATADQTRDTMLQTPEFFGAAPAGKAVFTAKGFKPLGKDRFAAQGTLAIKGVKVPVRLLFNLTLAGERATVKGRADLDRLALHVGTGQWGGTDQIGAGVALRFSFQAHRAKAP